MFLFVFENVTLNVTLGRANHIETVENVTLDDTAGRCNHKGVLRMLHQRWHKSSFDALQFG